jgi:uncharacterized membrane protein YgcG
MKTELSGYRKKEEKFRKIETVCRFPRQQTQMLIIGHDIIMTRSKPSQVHFFLLQEEKRQHRGSSHPETRRRANRNSSVEGGGLAGRGGGSSGRNRAGVHAALHS